MSERSFNSVKDRIKRLLHKAGLYMVQPHVPLELHGRTSASTKAAMASMVLELQAIARASGRPLPRLCDSGFRVFSQFEEDGYLVYLAAVLELDRKIFLDI